MSTNGSVWRKWDLHIHTPASFEWRGERFQGMNDEQIERACHATINASQVPSRFAMDVIPAGVGRSRSPSASVGQQLRSVRHCRRRSQRLS